MKPRHMGLSCFSHYGQPKKRFESQEDAERWIIENNQRDRFAPYHCRDCGGYHLGKKTK